MLVLLLMQVTVVPSRIRWNPGSVATTRRRHGKATRGDMARHGREQFGAELRRLRNRAGLSLGELAKLVHVNRGYVGHIEHGQRWPSKRIIVALDHALGARCTLLDAWNTAEASRPTLVRVAGEPIDRDELEAVELVRRVAASDLGGETLARLEAATDDLATCYPVTAPNDLLDRVRTHLGYVSRLIDARAT